MAEYNMEHKTKDYVRRAQNNYNSKFDRVSVRLPKGTSEVIREKTGLSINNYLLALVQKDLKENYDIDITE